MKAYITGVAGFLGSNLAKRMVADGWTVYGCDTFVTSSRETLPMGVRFEQADICELQSFPRVDVVVHTAAIARSAWPDSDEIHRTNVDGTKNVLMLAKQVGARFVHCSSCVAAVPYIGEYALSKLTGERYALANGATCLRYSNIYGPGQSMLGPEPNVIAAWQRQIVESGTVRVDGDGSQRRDFLFIDDAVEATLRASLHEQQGAWFDVCTGTQTPIIQVARRFDVPIEYAPRRENDPDVIPQIPYVMKKVFGFKARVGLDEGFQRTIS